MYETLEHWKQYKQEKALQAKIAKEYKLDKAIKQAKWEKEMKVIVVDINGGFYKITTDVEGYYSTTTQGGYGKNVLQVILDRIQVNDGVNDLSKYELIIK